MSFWNSLAGRLFKLVFGSYLILAIIVTAIQLFIEYAAVHNIIYNDIQSLGKSFSGGITNAMWEIDRDLLKTMAKGISQSSIVTGVRIISADGEVFAEVGETPNTLENEQEHFFGEFQFFSHKVSKQTPTGLRELGAFTIYSNRSVALSRIKYSFFVILINSIIKTTGLWIIFYIVITKSLSKQLAQLSDVVSGIRFASETNQIVHIDYPHNDELGILSDSMIKMQKRLYNARRELHNINLQLENTVLERTQQLADALSFSDTILKTSPIPIAVYKRDGSCALVNEAYSNLLDFPFDKLTQHNFNQLQLTSDINIFEACLFAIDNCSPQQLEMEIKIREGKTLWVECKIHPIHSKNDEHFLIQFFDLTERKRIEENLRVHAFYDSLTSLPNRRLLHDRIEQAIRTNIRNNRYSAILYIDLDKFKHLNDTHGHEFGDKMLIEVAHRLQRTVRSTDTVARLGGDEFVVLLEDVGKTSLQSFNQTSHVLCKIDQALRLEYCLDGLNFSSSASIGFKIFKEDDNDPNLLIKEADETMYQSKRNR